MYQFANLRLYYPIKDVKRWHLLSFPFIALLALSESRCKIYIQSCPIQDDIVCPSNVFIVCPMLLVCFPYNGADFIW